jgi:hypothetical protein
MVRDKIKPKNKQNQKAKEVNMSSITKEKIAEFQKVCRYLGNNMSLEQARKEMISAESKASRVNKTNKQKEVTKMSIDDMTDEVFGDGSGSDQVDDAANAEFDVMAEAKAEAAKAEAVKTDEAFDLTRPAPAKTGKFFKRTKSVHYIRFYTFTHGGKTKLSVEKASHWIDGKCFPCSGDGCKMCKDKRASVRYVCNVVDRAAKPNIVQIWDVPSTVYTWIYNYAKDLDNPAKCFGNSGKTFKIAYDDGLKRYNVTPYEKDTAVLDIKETYDLV